MDTSTVAASSRANERKTNEREPLVPGSEVHSRMLRGIVKNAGDGGGEERDVVVPLYSAYASALAENRILGGDDGGVAASAGDANGGGGRRGRGRGRGLPGQTGGEGGGGGGPMPMGIDRGDGTPVDAAKAATVAIGPHGEPAHTNVTPG